MNYDLGRFYESQGRHRRAFSRYVQAVISPESGALAIEAMQRVQPLLAVEGDESREPYSVAMVERMIAGRVRSFGAASPFLKTPETPVVRTVLVEFFTNGHYGNEERGGAIGGALGMEGLIGHFSPDGGLEGDLGVDLGDPADAGDAKGAGEPDEAQEADVVFLEYHLPSPRPDALCTGLAAARAAQLRVSKPEVIVVDGQVPTAGAGKWRDAEEIYNRGRKATMGRLAVLGDHEIDLLGVTYSDGVLAGSVEVFGPRGDDLAVQVVLAEGRVLYPGSSGVIVHRRVARGSLLDLHDSDDSGALEFSALAVGDDEDEVIFEFSRSVADIEDEMAAYLTQLEEDGVGNAPRISMAIDPREIRVIAFLFDRRSGAVLSADELIPNGLPAAEDAAVELPEEDQR